MSLVGLDGYLVFVQVDVNSGIPNFDVVGLPDTSIKESKERVLTAIRNSGIQILSKKIIINLAPANTKKEGPVFDVPIAVGVLISTNQIRNKNLDSILEQTVFIGELSLDGKINKIPGILPICIEAKKLGVKQMIIPKENAKEASIIGGIDILPAENLNEIISFLNGNKEIKPYKEEYQKKNNDFFDIDFLEVKGQENVKRALEISAAGNHNCLLIGAPRNRKNDASQKNTYNFTPNVI